jgi:hypothetical protein
MIATRTAKKSHFHIRWSTRATLDWQSFETMDDAEHRAEELVGRDESYTIEQRSDWSCELCGDDFALYAWTDTAIYNA